LRKDRSTSEHGGVAVFLNNTLPFTRLELLDDCDERVELLKLVLHGSDNSRLHIGLVYRPPGQEKAIDDSLFRELEDIVKRKSVLILGDFNAPSINWSSSCAIGNNAHYQSRLLDFALDNFLMQHVCVPTRDVPGQTANCLDLIFTLDDDDISELERGAPLGLSDHLSLTFTYVISSSPEPLSEPRRNIWKADFEQMRFYLSEFDWDDVLKGDVDCAWEAFNLIIDHMIRIYYPLKKNTLSGRHGSIAY